MPVVPSLEAGTELRKFAELTGLPAESVAQLAAATVVKRVYAGTVVVRQGEPAAALVAFVRGAAIIERQPEGQGDSIVIDVLRAPSLYCDSSLFDQEPAPSSLITVRASDLLSIDRADVARLASRDGAIAQRLLSCLAARIQSCARRMEQMATGSVEERLVALLDDLALRLGTNVGAGRFIPIPLRRRDLGSMVLATPETVSRLLAKFEREQRAKSSRDGIWWLPRRSRERAQQEKPPPPPSSSALIAVSEPAPTADPNAPRGNS